MFCATVENKFSGVSDWLTQGNLTIFPFRYLIPHPRANNYTPRFEVYRGYIGFTLSVRPSGDIFCKPYLSETIGQNFMKLHSNDCYQA